MSQNFFAGKKWRFCSPGVFLFVFWLVFSPMVITSRATGLTELLGYYQTARLTDGELGEGDSFGSSVAISGSTAIIGAPLDDDDGMNSGSAYVYVYNPIEGEWNQAARLNASNGGPYEQFGASVAIIGDTAFVGAPVHAPGGLVYVFERNQGGPDAWGEVRQIVGDEVTWSDQFGISMDASGDRLIVGAYAGGDYDGSAYIFERDQGGPNAWGQVARLVPADNPAYNYFGYSVAISGDTAAGGAPGYNEVTGAAYIFQRQPDQSWLEVAQLMPDNGISHEYFGLAVDLDGDVFAAGAPAYDEVGAVYLFERDHGGPEAWGQSSKLLARDGVPGDSFGRDVLVDQGLVFAGATGRQEAAGAIYIFEFDPAGGNWEQAFRLDNAEPAPGEGLGDALAADDLILLAGAPGAAPGGAVVVYTAYSPPAEINLMLAPNPIPEGADALVTGSFSDPDPGESHTLKVQWGDGLTNTLTLPQETYAFTMTHTYLDDEPSGEPADPYTLTVTITDTHEGIAWAQLPLVVENMPPSIDASLDAYLNAGESLVRWGSFTDPGSDSWTGVVDYGDGSGVMLLDLEGQAFWLEHVYPIEGVYWTTITVTDDDSGQDTSQFMVRVAGKRYRLFLTTIRQ